MSTRELVDALISGDTISIENSFNSAMSEKISAALDSYRVQVAQTMFAPEEQAIQQTDDNTNAA